MTWLTWRQHRIEVLVMGMMVLGFAIVLLVMGINIALEAQRVGFTPCPGDISVCFQSRQAQETAQAVSIYVNHLTQSSAFRYLFLVLPYILPVFAGIFIGAPALSREFEQGTYRLAWTQGIPWSRWFFKKTGLLILAVTCAFAILFGLFSWWIAALSAPLSVENWVYGYFDRFDTWGVVIIAYAVFAVALGLFLGTLVRKPVAAMAMTLVFFVLVRVLVTHYWRPYYLPPVVSITPFNTADTIPVESWIINSGGGSTDIIDRHGQPVSLNDLPPVCGNLDGTCLNEHGYREWMVYQPADRYWLLQWIESGIYLLFSALLVALTFWWTKYRIIGKEGSGKDRKRSYVHGINGESCRATRN